MVKRFGGGRVNLIMKPSLYNMFSKVSNGNPAQIRIDLSTIYPRYFR
jgi:hypothetical protein